MEKYNPVKCRVCGKTIDRKVEVEGIDWIMPSRNYFYHIKCYNEWKAAPNTDDEWHGMIYDFLSRDLKVSYNYFMIEKQIQDYLKTHQATMKGIYFALKYFYEVKQNSWDEKGHGGIGIVPYVYKDSVDYWVEQEHKHQGFIKDLEEELKKKSEREIKHIKYNPNKKTIKKPKYNLEDI